MDKENNIAYVKTKKGIYKCYKSESMNKPIYYPVKNKTNGFIDYTEIIKILNKEDLYNELKKKDEVIKELTKNENSNNFLKDSLKLQIEFNKLLKKNNLTMIGLRNLCIPFRDKYNFTDHQTLRIAREEVTKEELLQILEDKEVK